MPPQTGGGSVSNTYEKMRRQAAILSAIAAIAALVQKSNDPTRLWPASIQILSICPTTFGLSKATNVTYQILSQLGTPMNASNLAGDSITESFLNQTGNMNDLNGSTRQTWKLPETIYSDGRFIDTLSVGTPFKSVSGTALQEFTATGWFGTQPLDITLAGGMSYSGVNFNTYSNAGSTVNGMWRYNCGR